MFNIHKKCEEKYAKLAYAYSECYGDNSKLRDEVTTLKQDNSDLSEALNSTHLHIEALCLINSALMDVVTKKQKERVCKIIKKKDVDLRKYKKLTTKKESKRGRKKRSK